MLISYNSKYKLENDMFGYKLVGLFYVLKLLFFWEKINVRKLFYLCCWLMYIKDFWCYFFNCEYWV